MLENEVIEKLKECFLSAKPQDTNEQRSLNVFGDDWEYQNLMRQRVPISIECLQSDKAFEHIYDCYDEAEARAFGLSDNFENIIDPVLIIQQEEQEPLAVMNWNVAIAMLQALYVNGEVSDDEEDHATKH
mgnify:CR=1 FL=1|tara:strand:+ start:122 stop:511 length:390 start_codon:yes stop_codon:yes gene_type:complete